MAGEFFDGPLCRQQRRGTPHFPVYKTTSPVVQPYGLTLSVVPVSRVCGYGEHQGCFFVLAHTTSKVYHCGRSDSSFHPASLCNSCYYGSPRTPQLSSLRGGYVLIGQTSWHHKTFMHQGSPIIIDIGIKFTKWRGRSRMYKRRTVRKSSFMCAVGTLSRRWWLVYWCYFFYTCRIGLLALLQTMCQTQERFRSLEGPHMGANHRHSHKHFLFSTTTTYYWPWSLWHFLPTKYYYSTSSYSSSWGDVGQLLTIRAKRYRAPLLHLNTSWLCTTSVLMISKASPNARKTCTRWRLLHYIFLQILGDLFTMAAEQIVQEVGRSFDVDIWILLLSWSDSFNYLLWLEMLCDVSYQIQSLLCLL